MHIIRLSGKLYILRRTFNRMRCAFFTSLFSQFFSAWCCTCSRTEKKRLCLLLDFLSFIIFPFKKISMCTSNIICVLQTHALFYRCHVLINIPCFSFFILKTQIEVFFCFCFFFGGGSDGFGTK